MRKYKEKTGKGGYGILNAIERVCIIIGKN